MALKGRISDLETTVTDLKEVLKKQTIKNAMIRDVETQRHLVLRNLKNKIIVLESLENELDILLDCIRKK